MTGTSMRRTRRSLIFAATSVAALMAIGSLAWACSAPEGATFFTDGKSSKMAVRGTRISAFGTNAHVGVATKLVIGSNGPHPTHACMVTNYTVNDTVRMPNPDGFIGPTAGPAGDANLAKGTYQVCFKDYVSGNVATAAATLTII